MILFYLVDGVWEGWTEWNTCSATCGLGQQQRYRVCMYPDSNCEGDACSGDDTQTRDCLVESCEEGVCMSLFNEMYNFYFVNCCICFTYSELPVSYICYMLSVVKCVRVFLFIYSKRFKHKTMRNKLTTVLSDKKNACKNTHKTLSDVLNVGFFSIAHVVRPVVTFSSS